MQKINQRNLIEEFKRVVFILDLGLIAALLTLQVAFQKHMRKSGKDNLYYPLLFAFFISMIFPIWATGVIYTSIQNNKRSFLIICITQILALLSFYFIFFSYFSYLENFSVIDSILNLFSSK